MRIDFESDGSIAYSGFRIYYQAVQGQFKVTPGALTPHQSVLSCYCTPAADGFAGRVLTPWLFCLLTESNPDCDGASSVHLAVGSLAAVIVSVTMALMRH